MRPERGLRKVLQKRLHAHLSACACVACKAMEWSEIIRAVRGPELDVTLFHGRIVAARPGDDGTWAHASSGPRAGTSGALMSKALFCFSAQREQRDRAHQVRVS